MIKISEQDYVNVIKFAKSQLPCEACGLVAGTLCGNTAEVKKIYFLTNTDHSEKHYSVDPIEQLNAIKDMEKNGLCFLGSWHSHPSTQAFPSKEDVRLAHDTNCLYFILSLEKEPVLNAFMINEDVKQQEIRILK